MALLLSALTLFAPLMSTQADVPAPAKAVIVQAAPDKCYEGVVIFDPVACSGTYGICGVVYEEVPCP